MLLWLQRLQRDAASHSSRGGWHAHQHWGCQPAGSSHGVHPTVAASHSLKQTLGVAGQHICLPSQLRRVLCLRPQRGILASLQGQAWEAQVI